MDSNFSITINTVTFVKMSFIFLGIIPFVRAIVYSQTTPSCCVMSLFLSHVSRSIQFRNVLLRLIFAISSFLVKRTTPFDKIDLVDQFYWNSLFGNFRLNFLVFMEIKEFIPNYRWKQYMLLIYMIDLKKKNNLLFVQAIWPDNADIPHISQESYIQVIQFCSVLFSLEGPAHAIKMRWPQ